MLTTAATHKHFRGERCPFISDVFIDTRVFECSCHAWGSHRNWRQWSCCLQDGGEPAVRATTVLGTDISISTRTEYKDLLQWKLLHCPQPVVVAWCGPRSSSCQTCHIHCKFLSSVVDVGFINSVVVSASWSQPVSTPSANFLSNRIIYTKTWTLPQVIKNTPCCRCLFFLWFKEYKMLWLDPSRIEYPSEHRYNAVIAQPVCFPGTFGNVLWREWWKWWKI